MKIMLSDVFKFTQGLGQKGHQIGRKVGDAIELLTLGMIHLDKNLTKFLKIEDGVEGATSAKHKVEFSFYNTIKNNESLFDEIPSGKSSDLFGIIECKKVGVEQTIKQSFKTWKNLAENKREFYLTNGYEFTMSQNGSRWRLIVSSIDEEKNNISLNATHEFKGNSENVIHKFLCKQNEQILIAVDEDDDLHILGPTKILSSINKSLKKCVIIEINTIINNKVIKINVNEALPGPQTPEKAKQASFVSLDVRKKILGQFDKSDNKSFISVLVIGESSHWENKSRLMIKLCNDYNLIIPDNALVYLFEQFESKFGDNYQDKITKTYYRIDTNVSELIKKIIEHFNFKIFYNMETKEFMVFKHHKKDFKNLLLVEKLKS